jgi:hypothetical protein
MWGGGVVRTNVDGAKNATGITSSIYNLS